MIHPHIINTISQLSDENVIALTSFELDIKEFQTMLIQGISADQYALLLLDWHIWNPEIDEKL